MKHSIFGLAFAFFVSLASPGPLQAQNSFNADTLITDFTEKSIAPVLERRGIVVTAREVNSDGDPYLDVEFANGMTGRISFTAKVDDPEKRLGMAIAISFTPRDDWSFQRKMDAINAFNRKFWLTQVTMAADDEIYIMRYSVCDFGVPQGNISSELLSFESLATQLQVELEKE